MIFLKILGTKTKFSQPLTNCGTHIVGQKWNTIFFFFLENLRQYINNISSFGS